MFQDLSKFVLPNDFRGKPGWFVQIWWFVQATLFRWSPQFAYGWRAWLLRIFGAKIGTGVVIRPTATFTYPWKISIGDHSWIGDDACLYSLGEIVIGADVVVSQKSYLCTGSHHIDKMAFDIYAKSIRIEDEAWVAADVFVAPGVTIGRGSVVGARSSVFNDLPAGMICLGNPAKPVKQRPETKG